MTKTRVRLYLDVDGVLNAWYADHRWGDIAEGVADRFTIKWSPTMVAALAALDVELVWLTTWRNEAQNIIEPLLGLTPHWFHEPSRVLHPLSGETTFPSMNWKFAALMVEQEENPCKFVWMDDELEHNQIVWARATNGLAIPVDHNMGITPDQIKLAKVFIDGVL